MSLVNTLRHVAKALSRGGLLLANPGIDSNSLSTDGYGVSMVGLVSIEVEYGEYRS